MLEHAVVHAFCSCCLVSDEAQNPRNPGRQAASKDELQPGSPCQGGQQPPARAEQGVLHRAAHLLQLLRGGAEGLLEVALAGAGGTAAVTAAGPQLPVHSAAGQAAQRQ